LFAPSLTFSALVFVHALSQAASQAPVAAENAMVVTAQHLATHVGVSMRSSNMARSSWRKTALNCSRVTLIFC
jgi:hypothetical protein